MNSPSMGTAPHEGGGLGPLQSLHQEGGLGPEQGWAMHGGGTTTHP